MLTFPFVGEVVKYTPRLFTITLVAVPPLCVNKVTTELESLVTVVVPR